MEIEDLEEDCVGKIKDAYYFPHDSNARNDPNILAMRSVYGWQGYGWYWMLIEMMREQSDYRLPLNKYMIDALAMQMQCDRNAAQKFIDDCVKEFQLLASDGSFLWSESLLRRMAKYDEKSEKARASAQVRWGKSECNANAMQTQCDGNASKVNKSKVNNIIYTRIFEHWNSKKIVVHRKLNDAMKRKINGALDDYTEEEILQSIDNYARILAGPEYYFSYKWTLQDFLARGLRNFINWETAHNNFLSDRNKAKKEVKPCHTTGEMKRLLEEVSKGASSESASPIQDG